MPGTAPSHPHSVQRHALLVLGMHRSGTSALTGLLVRLGAQAPSTLMRANVNNPLGFWESQPFCEFHDRLLRTAGTSWDAWTQVATEALGDQVSSQLASECRLLLEHEFGNAVLLAIKDPRACRLVPFWLQVLQAEAIVPAPVLVIRNPFEVARSLERASGVSRDHSLLMWLRHVLDSEIATRRIRRSIVRYHDLLTDPRTVMARISGDLGLQWPSSLSDEEMARILKPERCDHEIGIQPPAMALDGWLSQTYEALENLVLEPQLPAAHETLDGVRSELNRTTAVFGSLIERERANGQALVEKMKQKQAEHQHRIESLTGERDQLAADRDRCAHQSATLQNERDQLLQRTVELESSNRNLTIELESARTYVNTILASVSWRLTAPVRFAGALLLNSFRRPRVRSTEED